MYSLNYIPIGVLMVVQNLGPLIVALVSYCVIREKTSVAELANMAICFAVISFIVLIKQDDDPSNNWHLLLGILLAFVSILLFSGTYVINRYLRDSHYIQLNACNMFFSFVISTILYLIMSRDYYIYTPTVLLGIVYGALGFTCGLCFIKAGQLQPASRIAALDFC